MGKTHVVIMDRLTKKPVGKPYKYENRVKARIRCDKLDLEYGAYRYYIKEQLKEG